MQRRPQQDNNIPSVPYAAPVRRHWSALRASRVGVLAAALLSAYAVPASAAGCGAVCLPLEALSPQNAQVNGHQLRLSLIGQYADFNHYREGTDSIANPGEASAVISQFTAVADYGVTRRFTASLLLPYVRKHQSTRKFGDRVAQGVGDIALFGRYAGLLPDGVTGPAVSVGLGVKFPTGSTDQPSDKPDLPPAMQVGSGAYDLLPTASYYQRFNDYDLYGSALYRVPVQAHNGYKFGREFQLHFGASVPLSADGGRVALLGSLDYADVGHDQDDHGILPAKLRAGTEVINTGGRFLDITPGVSVELTRTLSLQARFMVPLYQDWNGDRAKGIGQVAQNLTTQLTLIYTGDSRL
ncbi:MAG: transporter [Gammaproteobacteria bacterium]